MLNFWFSKIHFFRGQYLDIQTKWDNELAAAITERAALKTAINDADH